MPIDPPRHVARVSRDPAPRTLHPMPPRPRSTETSVRRAGTGKLTSRQVADRAVTERATAERGVLSLGELRACGISRDALLERTRRGWLNEIFRGVYAVGHVALIPEAIWLAAVKACGTTAVLSHFSAAALWGFVEWDDRRPDVSVSRARAPRHPGIRTHQTKTLTRRDVMAREGIPVTAPARTLLDLASQLPPKALRRAVREAMARERVGLRELADVIARSGPRRGSRKLAGVVADGYTPTDSVLEDVVLDLILAGGFEPPDVGKPLVIDGRRIVPDFRWPAERLIVEADGAKWHDNKIAREDDAERQAFLEAHGERVIRVSWHEAVRKQQETWARLQGAGAPIASETSVQRA
jgi:Protein of unknown function (DUF559)/Transcriptional regulator, AbiEi antitoxin